MHRIKTSMDELKGYMITNEDYISHIQKHNLQKKKHVDKYKRLTKENKMTKFHQNAQKNIHKKATPEEDLYFLSFYYFFIEDDEEFHRVHTQYSDLQQAKYQIIEQLKTKTEEAKRKFKLDDLQNKLGSMLSLDICELKYLAIAFKQNYIFSTKYFYEIMTNNEECDEYIIVDVDMPSFFYRKSTRDNTTTNYMLSQRYEVKHIEAPIRKISTYKLGDLVNICNTMKLDMDLVPKKTKKHLYELITQSF